MPPNIKKKKRINMWNDGRLNFKATIELFNYNKQKEKENKLSTIILIVVRSS
jgi:hypothetical protein